MIVHGFNLMFEPFRKNRYSVLDIMVDFLITLKPLKTIIKLLCGLSELQVTLSNDPVMRTT